jgi:hypothetical protein
LCHKQPWLAIAWRSANGVGHRSRGASRIDELRHFFLPENRGQAVRLLGIGSVSDTPRLLERLNVEKKAGHTNGSPPTRATTGLARGLIVAPIARLHQCSEEQQL